MSRVSLSGDHEADYDLECPECGNQAVNWRTCVEIHCVDGWIDLHASDDPLWYDEGDVEMCIECQGTGIEHWCPACGENLSGRALQKEATP